MDVLVLCGGPDREREVSLTSGANVAAALRAAGHAVVQADAGPGDASAIERFAAAGGAVVFPAMHGRWGEGGPLQERLERSGLPYVGCGPGAARRCMDKAETKRLLDAAGLPTPAWGVVGAGDPPPVDPPVVVKAIDEGSSFATIICFDADAVADARRELAGYDRLLIERFIEGREITVGMVAADVADPTAATDAPPAPLPPIEVVPAAGFYDYEAKYRRDDTTYRFDLDASLAERVAALAVSVFAATGCRDLGRVDFMVDAAGEPWVLEINTMPGFTGHSLLPMAARRAGIEMPTLCDRLVRRAAARGPSAR